MLPPAASNTTRFVLAPSASVTAEDVAAVVPAARIADAAMFQFLSNGLYGVLVSA